ncbi:D-alanyl-D-alanine carboxypeptidase [Bacillus haynesii]|uniref:D-alanyl-D-alanine carboxypeptidase family protein n=1 Tax=Bacillus haynesii TaxID=1925021 RepID=UPI00228169DF|nr:D-alanyl-D-alanine carboxypeptidase family protein [Bacillus haynesii]MCY8670096.1 D-alanyl-D-alanine carboxypeptidase [Bacillus haynesii]
MNVKRSLLFIIVLCLTLFFHSSAQAGEKNKPEIKSVSAILIDGKSGQVLYEKNSRKKMYPASITKIATAIYAIENGNLEDRVKVSKNAAQTEGSSVYLEAGESVPLKRLLQGLLMNSGNDAGTAIAEHVSGSVKQFADDLNAYIAEHAGVHDTHFMNPHGLFDKNHYTTSADMARITEYAMKNKTFRALFSEKQTEWHGQTWDTTLKNHHRMLTGEISYQGITGGKTGFVNESKHTLVTTATRGSLDLIAVVMKADSKKMMYSDTKTLLDEGFRNYETQELKKGEAFTDRNGTSHELKGPLYVTKKKGEVLSENVDSDGILNIKGEDGRLLQALQIAEPFSAEMTSGTDGVHGQLQSKGGLFLFVFGLIGLLTASYAVKRMRQL